MESCARPDARGLEGRARPRGVTRDTGPCCPPSIPRTTRTDFRSLGQKRLVERLGRSDLAAFTRGFCFPGRPTIVVAGDVDPDALARELERRLAALAGTRSREPRAASGRAIGPASAAPARPPGRCPGGAARRLPRAVSLEPGLSNMSWSSIRSSGGQFTSRLNESLREERGLTYGVRSSFDFRKQPGPFTVSASVQTEKVGEALEQIRIELEAIAGDRPPTAPELENARRSLIEGHPRHFEITGSTRQPICKPRHSRSAGRSRCRLLRPPGPGQTPIALSRCHAPHRPRRPDRRRRRRRLERP